jgi:predicted nucleic acid-binding protein
VTRTYVLDANAVLDLVEAGAGFGKVEKCFSPPCETKFPVLLSVLNWGEVFYLLWQRRGEDKARQTLAKLSRLPLQILPVDFPQALKAGELKAVHKIPYVDCVTACISSSQPGVCW